MFEILSLKNLRRDRVKAQAEGPWKSNETMGSPNDWQPLAQHLPMKGKF
jgi:hypothetical protein